MEQRFQIMMVGSKTKEKPPIDQVFARLDQLEKGWGKDALQIIKNDLIISDENGTKIGKIILKTEEEKQWVQLFYGIK